MNESMMVEHLFKSYYFGNQELKILKDISFEVKARQMVSMMGMSGAGKSTLLHILGTLDQPTSGKILYHGEEIFQKSEKELAKFRNQRIGFVFQFHHLLPEFSALENVMMPALIAGKSVSEAERQAVQLLKEVYLSERLQHRPSELSGGEQQRVAIARALVLKPAILLADELTGNLDSKTADHVMAVLFELHEKNQMTTLLVTHNETLAKKCPIQYVLADGQLRRVS
ncbi:MAG: ABC transporter ATP-binding protein [Deltaproteobacteria bacterium]|nr:ABC transporter ATP-binding protein [Deltaproteobacteria bacterium]